MSDAGEQKPADLEGSAFQGTASEGRASEGGGFLLALEGGGTRSQAALMDERGRVLAVGTGGDVNTNFTPYPEAQEAVRCAVRAALTAAGVRGEQVGRFAIALVGPRFGAETLGEICPNASYRYYGERDVVFARAGLVDHPHGVALVAATGATAFGLRHDGRSVSLGGWGSLLGDEGSAYDLGLNGLRAAVRDFEGRGSEPTRLVAAVCEHFSIPPADFHRQLVELAYGRHLSTEPLSRAQIAGFAAAVTRLAALGDPAAARLTRQAANELADLALHAARRLFAPDEEFVVAAAGGMTAAGDLVLGPLKVALAHEFPRAELRIGTLPPAEALGLLVLNEKA
jgi:N-acetylglucosamine kinase-like BadF-type ATPase